MTIVHPRHKAESSFSEFTKKTAVHLPANQLFTLNTTVAHNCHGKSKSLTAKENHTLTAKTNRVLQTKKRVQT